MLSVRPDHLTRRFDEICRPGHSLCKEDVVWMLDYIKKKVAERDPKLADLSQPRIMQNFHFFAEAAMLLIHRRPLLDLEAERLRSWLQEASFGLHDCDEQKSHPND